MGDEQKTKVQLLNELDALRCRVEELQRADIDRGLIESRLRESEQLYHGTIDAMEDIIHVVDRDLRITLANTALRKRCEELGIPLDGVIGRSVFDLFPFLSDTVRKEYEQVLATGEQLHTTERTATAGKVFWTETVKIPVLEESAVECIVTVVRT